MASCGPLVERMDRGVSDRVFPAGVLLAQRSGKRAHLSAHGRLTSEQSSAKANRATCFDLASLTKVLSATSLCCLAVQSGSLSLSDRVCNHLPGYRGGGRGEIRIVHLLDHSSGLAPWRAFYEEVAASAGGSLLGSAAGRDAMRRMVFSERPETEPGSRAQYSDLGFILLDWILERIGGKGCRRLFAQRVARPLDLKNLFFVDLTNRARAARTIRARRFAATERCAWRGRTLQGEVHDPNAYAMGGVSGHAGLFGTAVDVARVAQAWLDGWLGRTGLFEGETVRRFFEPSRVSGSVRRLGFDGPAKVDSQAGIRMGRHAVGHLGFTGTSLWIDPVRELIVVLLTNRVHPSSENEDIQSFRPGLHDLVMEHIG